MSPVRRHLATMRVGISLSADTLQKHFQRRHPQLQTQCAIAIVGIEPIVARLQTHARGHQDRFVTGAADLKEDPVLAFHLDFFVVQAAREIHHAKDLQHLFTAEIRSLMWFLRLSVAVRHRLDRRCRGGPRNWVNRRLRFRLRNSLRGERLFRQIAFGLFYQSENFEITHDYLSPPSRSGYCPVYDAVYSLSKIVL